MVAVEAAIAGKIPAIYDSQYKPMFDTYKCWRRQDSRIKLKAMI
jgi:hypothetical protein